MMENLLGISSFCSGAGEGEPFCFSHAHLKTLSDDDDSWAEMSVRVWRDDFMVDTLEH